MGSGGDGDDVMLGTYYRGGVGAGVWRGGGVFWCQIFLGLRLVRLWGFDCLRTLFCLMFL